MTSAEAYHTLKSLLQSIDTHKSLADLNELIKYYALETEISDFYKKYPRLNFKIDKSEINELIDREILTKNNTLNLDNFKGSTLEKLLVATLWKNGDLNKICHIVDGILQTEDLRTDYALVFKQFGSSLANASEPIVDQHVLRAFEIGTLTEFSEASVDRLRKKSIYKSSDNALLTKYRNWFQTILAKIPQIYRESYKEQLDKVLFIKGKSVKI